ncbi:hypothetical protein ABXS71_20940 [Bacillus infantis]
MKKFIAGLTLASALVTGVFGLGLVDTSVAPGGGVTTTGLPPQH